MLLLIFYFYFKISFDKDFKDEVERLSIICIVCDWTGTLKVYQVNKLSYGYITINRILFKGTFQSFYFLLFMFQTSKLFI